MKKWALVIVLFIIYLLLFAHIGSAQCSICTKTAQQLGEKPAKGLNAGIIYLAVIPFAVSGYVYYRWKKSYK